MSDSLGESRGRIVIDTSSVRRAQQEVAAASRGMNQALGAIGISLTAAGFVQLAQAAGRFAIEADAIATAYRRQQVAAVSLAGSQSQLNDLLATYQQVTGGAVDKAQALADVTRLIAVGFADSSEELERIVTISRGAALAMGSTQEYILGQVQLALANQTTARLDQIGVGVEEFQQRMEELRQTNQGWSKEVLFQNTLLDLMEKKFRALADSSAAAATGAERAAAEWKNTKLALGELVRGPVGLGGSLVTAWLAEQIYMTRMWEKALQDVARALGFAVNVRPTFDTFVLKSSGSIGGQATAGGGGAAAGPTPEQSAAILEWSRSVQDIERQANADRLQATQQYEEQRASVLRQYGVTMAREAEDFARQRQRAEEDLARSITRLRTDALRQEQRAAADFARGVAQMESEAGESLAKTRADSNKRLVEIEQSYTKSRERAARDHADRLRDAAARLDAVGIREAQRNFRRQQEDAKENFDEQRSKIQEQLDERLQDEAKALAKSTAQANEAYQRQLADAREATAQREADMLAESELRKEREDEDRITRLNRLQQDHNAQLAEQARQHDANMVRIDQQAKDEYQRLKESYDKVFHDLGLQVDGYTAKLTLATEQAFKLFDALYGRINTVQGPLANPWTGPTFGGAPNLNPIVPATSSVSNSTRSNTVNIHPGAVQILAPANFTADSNSRAWLHGELAQFFEDYLP